MIDGVSCGHLGAIHPVVKKNFDDVSALLGAELNLAPLQDSSGACTRRATPRFPGIELTASSFLNRLAQDVLDLSTQSRGDLMDTITIFDLYRGNPVPADHKALAYVSAFAPQIGHSP